MVIRFQEGGNKINHLKGHLRINQTIIFDFFGKRWKKVIEFLKDHFTWSLLEGCELQIWPKVTSGHTRTESRVKGAYVCTVANDRSRDIARAEIKWMGFSWELKRGKGGGGRLWAEKIYSKSTLCLKKICFRKKKIAKQKTNRSKH